jgi:predicted dehydrogenase
MGVIGTGNQGTNDMNAFLRDGRVRILAVCDVNREGPDHWHAPLPIACPTVRKDIYCRKPLSRI